MRRAPVAVLLAALLSLAAAVEAQETSVVTLKDGREFAVTELVRQGGYVVFRTAAGAQFRVPEASVVAPPLDEIATAILELRDGRRLPVRTAGRRGGYVFALTLGGQNVRISEADVVAPPLDRIASLEPEAAPPAPETPAEPPPTEPAVPAPTPSAPRPVDYSDFVPLADRWSIAYPAGPRQTPGRVIDPYNQNILKGDRPVIGESVFLVLTGTLDVPTEFRRAALPSGVTTARPGSREFFGEGELLFTSPRAVVSVELFKGQTAFQPRQWALRVTGVANVNYLDAREVGVVHVDPTEGTSRRRQDLALEEAFAEVKLKDLGPDYDTVSLRAGIQPLVTDFRGFVFADFNLGARLFGNLGANRWQYNVAAFSLLEKQTNSELNTLDFRKQKVVVANLFRQDTFALGHTLEVSWHWSKDSGDKPHYDANGFLVRPARIGDVTPHEVEAHYAGVAGDGHFGRLNTSWAVYLAHGTDSHHPLEGPEMEVRAGMAAVELSVDRDWARFKLSGFFASGDDDAGDGVGHGFDSIYDSPNFAGGPFSFWQRSGLPLTQTAVQLKSPFSLLPSLRSNKFEGQANYVNPGLLLLGAGVDVELTPKLKLITVANYLRFHKTGALSQLLFQPGLDATIGLDLGAGLLWRPLLNENVVVSAGISGLKAGAGFEDLFSSNCDAAGCGAPGRDLFNGFVQVKLTF